MKIQQIQDINFQGGLSSKILVKERLTNVSWQQKIFEKKYGSTVDMQENKGIMLANRLCANLIELFTKKNNIEFVPPPMISVFNPTTLEKPNNSLGFCTLDTQKILKDELPFPGRSLFFRNIKNLEEIDSITEELFAKKRTSSSHFLAPYIHEWIHSLELDYLFRKHGYGGNCKYLKKEYPLTGSSESGYNILKELQTKVLTPNETDIVKNELGEYAIGSENQYLEIFSETMTKFICESLSKDCTSFIRNPLDLINKTRVEFQNILRKITNFE